MKITKGIRKSHNYNEDKIIIGNNYFMVCDGATPLYKIGIKPTEAAWFVTYIKKHMPKNCNNVIEKLNDISKEAYKEFFKLNELNHINKNDILYYPSCGIAWVELKDDDLYVYTIGDCEAVIKTKENEIIRIILPILPKLDNEALSKIIDYKNKHNLSIKEATGKCIDVLLENRKLMNKENGYTAFSISDNPTFKYTKHIFKKENVKELYLYTDGITQAFDELKIYNSCEEMFKESIDINEEIKKIEKRAYEDKNCNIYPRFKTIDDIAIIKIEF